MSKYEFISSFFIISDFWYIENGVICEHFTRFIIY